MPQSVITGSHGNHIFSFTIKGQNVFQSGCTILLSCQQCMSGPVSLHICQHLVLSRRKKKDSHSDEGGVVVYCGWASFYADLCSTAL